MFLPKLGEKGLDRLAYRGIMLFMDLLWLFGAGFLMIFLRAFQQKNVQLDKTLWVLPTSICMAASEALIIVRMAEGWSVVRVLTYGISAGTGCLAAMFIHSRLRGEK